MKKSWKHISLSLLALAPIVLAGCDQEKDLYNPDYAKQQYNQSFVKQFGEIPEGQTWDFYASLLNGGGTRAAADASILQNVAQPINDYDFATWQTKLESGVDNTDKGIHDYTLTSIDNGRFYAYAIWYAGWYETYAKFDFSFHMVVKDENGGTQDINLFKGRGSTDATSSERDAYTGNPGGDGVTTDFGRRIYVTPGDNLYFYMKYNESGDPNNPNWKVLESNVNSTLLYNVIENNKKVMVIGFEDKPKTDWDYYWLPADFNDVVLYLVGDPDLPLAGAKRFMCEDLGTVGDFDFNDVVVDVQKSATENKLFVTLQAAGGTLPATLYVAGKEIGEVHGLFKVDTSTMVNTGAGTTKDPVQITLDAPAGFDLTSFTDVKVVVTNKDGSTSEITYTNTPSDAPCMIATPVETNWMKETINIKEGYPKFFTEDASWINEFNIDNLYQQ